MLALNRTVSLAARSKDCVMVQQMWSVLIKIQEMNQKIYEMKSKLKRPNLKRVKLSAEQLLSVLLGSKHTKSIDFKANLKTAKKEEEKV